MKELKSRYIGLIKYNIDLQDLVKRYYQLKQELRTNTEKKSLHERVNNLWKGIYQNSEKLEGEGACVKCPKKYFLDYF